MKHPAQLPRRGFLLLEMVLALMVFGMAATGFVVALHRMSAAASFAQSELRLTRILDSALDEILSLPVLEEGETNTTVGETGIELDTTIALIEDLETRKERSCRKCIASRSAHGGMPMASGRNAPSKPGATAACINRENATRQTP